MSDTNEDLQLLYGLTDIKKITKGKRILSALIDFLIIVITYGMLFYTIGTISIKACSSNNIANINNEVVRICESYNYPYKEGYEYGIYTFDTDAYYDVQKQKNPSLSEDELAQKSSEAFNNLTEGLNNSDVYNTNYNEFYRNYFLIYTATIAIVNIAFELIIPMFDKKQRTIGMMIIKQALVNIKNNEICSNVKVMIRFFILFVAECVLFRLLLTKFLFLILPLLALIFILATKQCFTLHEVASGTKVIDARFIGLVEDNKNDDNVELNQENLKNEAAIIEGKKE